MSSRTVSQVSADALFKEFYFGQGSTSLVNKNAPLASVLMKNKSVDWVGDNFVAPLRFGSATGLGYRALGANLPDPVAAPRNKAVFGAKRGYATAEFDREAIVSSRNDRGAFAKVTVDEVEAVQEGFLLHMIERPLFGDSTGKLGEITSFTGAGTTASPWVITGATNGTNAPKHKARYYPKGAKLDLWTSAGVYQLTVEVVAATATTVSVVLVSTGSAATPTNADLLYWEGDRNGEIVGLKTFTQTTTIYGINNANDTEFKATSSAITGSLQFDDINNLVSSVEEVSGESPKLGVCSHLTLAGIKNLSEDQKRYNVAEAKSSDLKIGFKGVEVMADEGPFPMISSQMCPEGEIWLINPKFLQLVMRQDFGWFDDDGTILLRHPNKDVYNSRYGGYHELFCSKPNSIGYLSGFSL